MTALFVLINPAPWLVPAAATVGELPWLDAGMLVESRPLVAARFCVKVFGSTLNLREARGADSFPFAENAIP